MLQIKVYHYIKNFLDLSIIFHLDLFLNNRAKNDLSGKFICHSFFLKK